MYYAKLKNTVSKGTYILYDSFTWVSRRGKTEDRPVVSRGSQGLRCGERLMMKAHGKIWGVMDLFYILTVVVTA